MGTTKIDAYLGDKSLRKQMRDLWPEQHNRLALSNPRFARHLKEEAEGKIRELTKQLQLSETYYNYFDYHYRNEIRMMKETVNDCNDLCDFID